MKYIDQKATLIYLILPSVIGLSYNDNKKLLPFALPKIESNPWLPFCWMYIFTKKH